MHIVFFDAEGVLVNWAVPSGTKINAEYYKYVLKEKLRPTIRKKRPGLQERGVIFHHDNAPVHTARLISDLLDDYDWEVLPHPKYSPDLAPADFYLFPKMKETLRGIRFESTEAINEPTSTSLRDLAKGGLGHVFDSWVSRWRKCVDNGG